MNKKWFLVAVVVGCVAAALAVAAGAFAAHALGSVLEPKALAWVETAARYQFYHALALLVCAVLGKVLECSLAVAISCFALGIVCFSGSLYVLALSGSKSLVYLTPLGGLLFIVGWLVLAVSLVRRA
ncbi:MAG: DUF423 domain-containing protein [Pseudomonadales bacterium]